MTSYRCFGLSIASALPLPDLDSLAEDTTPDVTISIGAVNPNGIPEGEQLGPFLWISSRAFWLRIPTIARFLVRDGTDIRIDPDPGIDEDSLRVYLLGSIFGALLFQRDMLVLHGNAIRVGNEALLCLGPSGIGKSTLAAGFQARGFDILADDVVPIDADYRAVPSVPRVKLWKDAVDHLDMTVASLRRVRPNVEKYHIPLPADRTVAPLPVRWIHILSQSHRETVSVTDVKGMKGFSALHENIYRGRYMDGMGLRPRYLERIAALSRQVDVATVTRPKAGFTVTEIIDDILAHIGKAP